MQILPRYQPLNTVASGMAGIELISTSLMYFCEPRSTNSQNKNSVEKEMDENISVGIGKKYPFSHQSIAIRVNSLMAATKSLIDRKVAPSALLLVSFVIAALRCCCCGRP